jgi:autotransporter-associated beta strand protein
MNASDSGAISFVPFSLLGGLSGSRNLDNGGHYLQIGRNNQSTSYSGVLSGTGGLFKRGTGTLTLSGSNSFTGDTYVQSGTLVIANANALAGSSLDMYGSDSGAITFSQASNIGGLNGSRDIDNGGNTLTIGVNNKSTTYSGVLSGTGGLTKNGTGTLALAGNNTFTGDTRISSGTLAIELANALAAASNLTVDPGATFERLGYSQTFADAVVNGSVGNQFVGGLLTVSGMLSGTGVVTGDVLVNGLHAPGNSPGIQTFNGDLTYGSGAVVNWELTGNTASNSPVVFDQIVLTGSADVTFSGSNLLSLSFNGAGSAVDWTNSFWNVNRAWTVFDLASGITTGFGSLSLGGSLVDANGLPLDAGTRGSFSLVQSGQDVLLAFTAVPEPSTCASLLAGLACGGYLSLRRRNRG